MQYNGKKLRHELKYFINYHEYSYLKTRLKTMMKLDQNSKDNIGYHIRSLYFDDIYHNALLEKESGVQFRKKYRIRIYNKEDKKIQLECKEKCGEFISKSSAPLTKEQFYKLLNGRDIEFLLKEDKQLYKDMFVQMRTKLLRPAVIVDYEREVFVLDEGNVRITFDQNLCAGINTPDIFSNDIIGIRAIEPGLMVLEVKYDDYLPMYVKKLLQIARHQRSAISKYVMCRKLQFERNPITPMVFGFRSFKEGVG